MVRLLLAFIVLVSMIVCTTSACDCEDEEGVNPVVETLDATNIMSVATTLNGNLVATGVTSGLGTNVWFEWWVGSDESTLQSTPTQKMTQAGTFSAQVYPLTIGSTYSFRACASDVDHSVKGATKTFYVP